MEGHIRKRGNGSAAGNLLINTTALIGQINMENEPGNMQYIENMDLECFLIETHKISYY